MSHPIFQGDPSTFVKPMEWTRLKKKSLNAPYIPANLIIPIAEVVKAADNVGKKKKTTKEKPPPFIRPSNGATLDAMVKREMEKPKNALMRGQSERTDLARRQMILSRQQQVRKVAYKKGRPLADFHFDNSTGERSRLRVQVLQRAAYVESMHSFVAKGTHEVYTQFHHLKAGFIQKIWRGRLTRKRVLNLKQGVVLVAGAHRVEKLFARQVIKVMQREGVQNDGVQGEGGKEEGVKEEGVQEEGVKEEGVKEEEVQEEEVQEEEVQEKKGRD